VGTVTQLVLSRFGSRRVVMVGLGLFLAALTLIVVALAAASMALFLAGTVVGGWPPCSPVTSPPCWHSPSCWRR